MNDLQHFLMRHESAPTNMAGRYEEKHDAAARYCKPFTESSMQTWLKLAVEPWRAYCPWRPDDLPPKSGNPRSLAKLAADPDLAPADESL